MNIHIIVIDDHPSVRDGIRSLQRSHPDICVSGEASDGETGLALVAKAEPDVVVLDINLPGISGRAVAERLAGMPAVGTVVYTGYDNPQCVSCLREEGVQGYVLKGDSPAELCMAIRAVANGTEYLSPRTQKLLAEAEMLAAQEPCCAWWRLTQREREIARMVALGCPSKLIGPELGISKQTVDNYRGAIMDKLQVHNAAELAQFTLRHQLHQVSAGRAMAWPCEDCIQKIHGTGRGSHTSLRGVGGMRETGDRRQETGDRRQEDLTTSSWSPNGE